MILPQRPRRKWLLLGGSGCALVVVVVVAVAVQAFFQLRTWPEDIRRTQKTVDDFLEAAGNRDAGAYDFLSTTLSSQKSLAQFQSELDANSDSFQVIEKNLESKPRMRDQTRTVEMTGTLKLRNGRTVPARFLLIVERGYWVIESYSIGK